MTDTLPANEGELLTFPSTYAGVPVLDARIETVSLIDAAEQLQLDVAQVCGLLTGHQLEAITVRPGIPARVSLRSLSLYQAATAANGQ
ncbi:hypothetical protein ACIRCZ_19425 [Leifsonia sp. NPDC102414]|uniref:hypothetical protein n=1 Tax=Leifsonia sp. NPDC102414 TaxID=3364124 RepID=UPI00381CA42A